MTERDEAERPLERARKIREERTGETPAAARMREQHTWVDLQILQAMRRGDFDDLPGAGKPIEDLGEHSDPEWWVKQLVERERITVLPPSVQLRKDDAELDARLDEMSAESEVRREVEEFNERVIRARYRPPEGPPLITMPRDVEQTVAAWAERRATRRAAAGEQTASRPVRRRWLRRRRG